jgi:endonuclease/exonuclease/phosphatase family metal-dependent hydrolase
MSQTQGIQFKLATWNVHRCIGSDGVKSRSRCAAVLREIDADIVVLQESESTPREAQNALAYFADETYRHRISGPTMVSEDSHYGNALLTRLPVDDVRHHNLSVPGREPRGAIDADLNIGGERVQLIATHLGLRPAERRHQVEALVPLLRSDTRQLVMLAGDLKEWFLWGRPLRRLHRLFSATPHRRSWPANRPMFALDRIWVNPRRALQSLEVHDSPLSRVASDHLPLVAHIRL